jgi:hypothetical protein
MEEEDPCKGCVHDGKSSCADRPCEGCPNEEHQVTKTFPDKEV